jgi:hypothetical protein
MHPSRASSPKKLRPLEDLNVLRNGLERHVERLGQLRYRPFLSGDSTQNFASSGVGQGLKDVIEMVGTGLNHLVERP